MENINVVLVYLQPIASFLTSCSLQLSIQFLVPCSLSLLGDHLLIFSTFDALFYALLHWHFLQSFAVFYCNINKPCCFKNNQEWVFICIKATQILMIFWNFCLTGKFKEAGELIQKTRKNDIVLDTIAYNTFIKSKLDAGMWELQFCTWY